MNVLVVPYPAFGHVNPMLPVITELAARGTSVRVIVDRRHAEAVRSAGADALTLPKPADVYVPARLSSLGTIRYLAGRIRKQVVAQAAARIVTTEVARDRPGIVVVDPMMPAADRAASRAGVRTALFSTTFAVDPYTPLGHLPWLTSAVNRLRPTVRAFRRDRLILVNAVPELQPTALSSEDVHFVGPLLRREPAVDVSRYRLPTTRPVLLVSPGTVFAREPAYFRAIAHTFADTPWLVLMATGQTNPTTIGPLPGNVVAARHLPQLALLPHASVFLTHAGMNSALEALAAGVPMVVAPRAGDQHVIARRLVNLAVAIPATRLRALRQTVEHAATDPAMRAAVTRWRERLSNITTVTTAADLILARSDPHTARRRSAARRLR